MRKQNFKISVYCKQRLAIFPFSAGISLTKKLSLAGNNYYFPFVSLVSDIPAGDAKLFLHCSNTTGTRDVE
jgi:hypothetical protein